MKQELALHFNQSPEFNWALSVVKTLKDAGFEAVFAGGAVRDAWLSSVHADVNTVQSLAHRSERSNPRPPIQDFDVATSAPIDTVLKLFSRVEPVGVQFGIVIAIDPEGSGEKVEVATFRSDGEYADGRRPTQVSSATRAEDAHRRDFTVNALFYDPIEKTIFDETELGLSDLKAKTLRAVGKAEARFREDHLRLIRLFRLAAQLDFEIESETESAALNLHALALQCAKERRVAELRKLFQCSPAAIKTVLARYPSVFEAWFSAQFGGAPFPLDGLLKNLNQVPLQTERLGQSGLQYLLTAHSLDRVPQSAGFSRDEAHLAVQLKKFESAVAHAQFSLLNQPFQPSTVDPSALMSRYRQLEVTDLRDELEAWSDLVELSAFAHSVYRWSGENWSAGALAPGLVSLDRSNQLEVLLSRLRCVRSSYGAEQSNAGELDPRVALKAPADWIEYLQRQSVSGPEFGKAIATLWTSWLFHSHCDSSN